MSGQDITAAMVGKRYGSVQALAGVNLEIAPGEFLVLLGPSGSGKSTLVRTLAGIERLDTGRLTIGGRVVDDTRTQVPPEKRDLAMVFQDYALWPHLTVAKNVGYPLRRTRIVGEPGRVRVGEALEAVGLGGYGDRYPSELSGGEQQRVALARAVVSRPGLLLFDEPLSNLDADLRERLRVEIASLTRLCGATAVYITHDQSEAFALADRIGVLDHGRLVQLADPEAIYQQPATPFVARFTGTAGTLPGRVIDIDDARVVIDLGPIRVRALPIGSVSCGDRVQILVRPAAAEVVADGTDDHLLPAVVTDVAFRGRGYDHVVSTAAGSLTGVHSVDRFDRGQHVGLRLAPHGCHAHKIIDADLVGSRT